MSSMRINTSLDLKCSIVKKLDINPKVVKEMSAKTVASFRSWVVPYFG
jgi:hypothetical protein